jgi:hypothetical protein
MSPAIHVFVAGIEKGIGGRPSPAMTMESQTAHFGQCETSLTSL